MRSKPLRYLIVLLIPFALSLAVTASAGMSEDMAITSKVQEKLQSDSDLMGSRISVETRDGEVTLKGMVDSQADYARAAKLARYVDGVKQVDNRLKTVKASSSNYGGSSRAAGCPVGANWAC